MLHCLSLWIGQEWPHLLEHTPRSPRLIWMQASLHTSEFSGSLLTRVLWQQGKPLAPPRKILQALKWSLSWKPPSFYFLKINFNGSVNDNRAYGRAAFIIKDHRGSFIVAGGSRLFDTIVPMAELRESMGRAGLCHYNLNTIQSLPDRNSSAVIKYLSHMTLRMMLFTPSSRTTGRCWTPSIPLWWLIPLERQMVQQTELLLV